MSIEFTKTNVLGTHILLECARFSKFIKRFIHGSTDELYGESAYKDGVMENSILEPTNPYAATKAAAEQLVRAYNKSYKLPTILTRGNNVYGSRQYPEKVIPKFIYYLQHNQPCPIHGDGSQLRNFISVHDTIDAFDVVLHKGIPGEVYNISDNNINEISVLNLAKKLIKIFGYENENNYLSFVDNRIANDLRYNIDSTKLRELGWSPKVKFDDGLRATIKWHLDNPDLNKIWNDINLAVLPHPQFPVVHTI